jgi:hypothetical protein
MKGANSVSPRTRRGAATERIISALADASPAVHDRQSFLISQALARQFGKDGGALSPQDARVAARTLGRLIAQGIVGEALFLRANHQKVNLTGAGLVSVSIDLTRLSDAWNKWKDEYQSWRAINTAWLENRSGPKPEEPPVEPSQELLVAKIIADTRAWLAGYLRESKNQLPLILRDISIVHGSNDFDLLIYVLYRDTDEFMRYIREVIQRAPFVQKTHTMQIGTWEGFPDIGRSALRTSSGSN